jgi:hypothetical protein
MYAEPLPVSYVPSVYLTGRGKVYAREETSSLTSRFSSATQASTEAAGDRVVLTQTLAATCHMPLVIPIWPGRFPVCAPVRFAVYPWIATVTQG